MEQSQTTLKTFGASYPSTSTWNNKTYRTSINNIKVYIPLSINIFKVGDVYNVNKTIEGFIIKRSGIDSKRHVKFAKNRTIILDGSMDCNEHEGEYEIEVLDEDTLKLIKI